MALPKPYKKPPPPKHTFVRDLDFEISLNEDPNGSGDLNSFDDRLSVDDFRWLIRNMEQQLELAIAELEPGETLFMRPTRCGYDGGIDGFAPVAERIESDEAYAARLKSYEDRAERKALSKVKTKQEEIAALEARLAKLKETP